MGNLSLEFTRILKPKRLHAKIIANKVLDADLQEKVEKKKKFSDVHDTSF